MASGNCPDCRRRIVLSPASVGQRLTCPHCDVDLEVVSAEPHLELHWVYDGKWEGSEEVFKDIVKQFCNQVWNKGELAVADKFLAPHCVCDDAFMPARGREGLKQCVAKLRSAFPDLRLTIEDLVAEDDKVVSRWSLRGTHQGELPTMGIRPTGEEVTLTGISIYRFEDRRIIEIWQEADYLGLVNQLRK
jgi:predicted ester cyclase